MAEAGIKINGKHYAIPGSLRVGETRQIKRITGLNPPEFMKAVNTLNETQDPDVGAAMVWWIVHREDPSFTVDQIDDLEWGQIESEDGEEATPSDPKDEGVKSDSSPNSVEVSNGTSVIPGEMIPANGGVPDSALYAHPT
jgi:hypothetical protein